MKIIILISMISLFSCVQSKKEVIVSTDVEEKAIVVKDSIPDFNTIFDVLKRDSNIVIVDSVNSFPDRPYIVCYMQRHNVTGTRKELSDYSSKKFQRVTSVTKEISFSFSKSLKGYDFPIYLEGLNQEANEIDFSINMGSQSFGGQLFDTIRSSHNRVFGIETRISRGRNIAMRTLEEDRSIFLKSKNYDNQQLEGKKKISSEYISNLPKRLDLFLDQIDQREFDKFISKKEMYEQILWFKNGLQSVLSKKRDIDHGIRVYVDYLCKLKNISNEIKINYRNKITVNWLPDNESSV